MDLEGARKPGPKEPLGYSEEFGFCPHSSGEPLQAYKGWGCHAMCPFRRKAWSSGKSGVREGIGLVPEGVLGTEALEVRRRDKVRYLRSGKEGL